MTLALAQKAEARALLAARGVPTRRAEDWKYSDLKVALGDAGIGAATASWSVGALPDGVEQFNLSRDKAPDWVRAHFARGEGHEMGAASLSLAAGGVALRVRGAAAQPIAIDYTGDGHLRVLLVLEAGASAVFVERLANAAFRNVGLEIALGEGASLEHVRLSPAGDGDILVEEADVRLAARAQYRAHYAGFGSRLSRMEVDVALEGAGAAAHLSGVALLDGARHSDVTTRVRHAVGPTASTQVFKHVAGGKARAVYQGKVIVAEGANGSDSIQSAKAILLGETAEADLKPELEILADDVKCAHGAAVGDLDAESLFYLRARGIPEAEARSLLLQAFLEDAVAQIAAQDQRELVRTRLLTALREIT